MNKRLMERLVKGSSINNHNCSAVDEPPVLISPTQGSGNAVVEYSETVRADRRGWGLWNVGFWTWCGCCTHSLTATVIICKDLDENKLVRIPTWRVGWGLGPHPWRGGQWMVAKRGREGHSPRGHGCWQVGHTSVNVSDPWAEFGLWGLSMTQTGGRKLGGSWGEKF